MIRFGLGFYRDFFRAGSVMVTGQRGSGKDMLMANIACRSDSYIGNVRYRDDDGHIPLDFSKLDVLNSSDDLISGDITPYEYSYPDGVDIFISDASIYFPSFDFKRLNSKYPRIPNFLALSRHLGDCNVHANAQNLERIWDKFREQSERYIYCRWCKVLPFGIVIQCLTRYDKASSCQDRVKPFNIPKPGIFAPQEVGQAYALAKARFEETYGSVHTDIIIYRNLSSYDTRAFKTILKGVNNEKNP